MGSKGSQTTATNQTQSYSPFAQPQIMSQLNQAQSLANQPAFTVPTAPVAGLNSQQQQAFGLAGNTGLQQPYINQAAQDYSAQGISQFFNPEVSAVTAQMNNIFGQQNAQNNGALVQNAGGVGANRIGVAQGELANQQGLAAGQTYANLYQQAAQQAQAAGAGQLAAGQQAQGANTADISNLLTTGGLQQTQQQNVMNAPYQQQLAQLALPYELSNFGTAATAALAPAAGGTATGVGQSTTQFNPSLLSQLVGPGIIGASLLARGGSVTSGQNPFAFAGGGASPIDVSQFQFAPKGGFSTAAAAEPHMSLSTSGPNMQQGQLNWGAIGQLAGKAANGNPSFGGGNALTDAFGGSSSNPLEGLTAADYGTGFAGGGAVGGDPWAKFNEINGRLDEMHEHHRQKYGIGGSTPTFGQVAAVGPVAAPFGKADGGGLSDAFAQLGAGNGVQDSPDDVDPMTRAMGLSKLSSAMTDAGYSPAVGSPQNPFRMPDQGAVDDEQNASALAASDAGTPGAPRGSADSLDREATALSNSPSAGSASPAASPAPPMLSPPAGGAVGSSGGGKGSNPFGGIGQAIKTYMHDPDKMALLAAGLETMRSGSVAQGMAAGTQVLGGAHKAQLEDTQSDQAQQKINEDAQEHQDALTKITAYQQANLDKTKFVPAGSIMTADGTVHPAVMDQASGKLIDAVTGQAPAAGAKISTSKGGPDPAIVAHIVDGIVSGKQPPTLTGLYGTSPAVRAALDEKGFDLATATRQWQAAQKQVASLNGPQMTRFVGLSDSVNNTINEVNSLAEQMHNSGIPAFNNAKLQTIIQTQGNSPLGQLATRYVTGVNTLKEEFANLANGGYAPTEAAWKLANDQINGNYGDKQLTASLTEVQRLINYRKAAIPGLSTMGPGAANRYTGQQAAPQQPPQQQAPATNTRTIGGKTYFQQNGQWYQQ